MKENVAPPVATLAAVGETLTTIAGAGGAGAGGTGGGGMGTGAGGAGTGAGGAGVAGGLGSGLLTVTVPEQPERNMSRAGNMVIFTGTPDQRGIQLV